MGSFRFGLTEEGVIPGVFYFHRWRRFLTERFHDDHVFDFFISNSSWVFLDVFCCILSGHKNVL